jgi:hypothetical protein
LTTTSSRSCITTNGKLGARVHLADAAGVIDAVGPAGTDHGQFVGLRGDMGKPVADPEARLTVLLPRSLGGKNGRVEFTHRRDHAAEALRHGLTGQSVERRLRVEEIDVAGAALHEEKDHAFGPPRHMRWLRRQWR